MRAQNRNVFHAGKGLARAAVCLMAWLFAGTAIAADLDFAKKGAPVHLVVGYQPYATTTWSSVVMRSKKFYEKYLPKGSTVEFQIALQGSTIIEGMTSGKIHVGYLGDMPAIVATTKQSQADIRLVGVVAMSRSMCGTLLVRKNAPAFATAGDAIKWLNNKQVAAPKGSCADRFVQSLFSRGSVTPASYKSLNIEAITAFMKEDKLDAAVVWEPTATRLVLDGAARRALTGAELNEQHGVFLAMRADLIQQRPDVVQAWLRAELDGQLYLADTKNAMEVVRMVREQTAGIPEKTLWYSLYGSHPENVEKARLQLPFAFTDDAQALIKDATSFLHRIKSINVETLRPEAVMPEFAREVLEARKLKAPVGEVRSLPDSAYHGG